jgi:hypothetical protein
VIEVVANAGAVMVVEIAMPETQVLELFARALTLRGLEHRRSIRSRTGA